MNPNNLSLMDRKLPRKQDNAQPQLYRIAWKRTNNGPGQGQGTKTFTLAEATDLAIELNEKYKDFHHYVQPV